MLSEKFMNTYKDKTPPWGFNGLGYIVYKRTYARPIDSENRTEEWYETIARCITGAQGIGAGYTQEEAKRLFDYIFNLKCSFSGRFLWQANTKMGLGYGDSLNNCWTVAIRKLEDVIFLFNELLLGGGVGYSVKRSDINELPRVKKNVEVSHENTKDADYIVPDSREGWVKLLENVLTSFFKTGESFTYSTILVRGKGEPIKQFGGKASGPIPLIDGITKICSVLRSREGKKLRSIDVLDICNIIGSIVVSGNVRRSAQIAVGDADDYLFLNAKRWDLGNIPNWRAFSNNTISADGYDYLSDTFWEGYNGNGEPYGLFNEALSRSQGRLGEYIEDNCELPNPCSEQILESYESCNLAEIFLNNVDSQDELEDITKLLYKTCKAITGMKYLHKQSEKVIHRNRRIGIGVTGILQVEDTLPWLSPTYEALRQFDKEYSKAKGVPESIKLTTVKPSGTLSLLAGATPGVHPAYAEYYIRRVRMASDDSLVDYCKSVGYPVEFAKGFDGTTDHSTVVVSFPCYAGENAVLAEDFSAISQLEVCKQLQTIWSDSSVSVTVYYKKEELTAIKEWLANNYEHSLKSVSFLLHSEHGFTQAPYEKITKEAYLNMVSELKDGEHVMASGGNLLDGMECSTGACPVR